MALLPEPRSSSFKFSLFTVTDADTEEDTEAASRALDTAVEGERGRSKVDEMVDE